MPVDNPLASFDLWAGLLGALVHMLFNVMGVVMAKRKREFKELARGLTRHTLQRLASDEPNRPRTYARAMDLIEILDGVFNIVRRIARSQGKLEAQEPGTP